LVLIPEIDAGEILTSLMLVYVANLGMDYAVRGPGAIRRACYASIIFFGHESSKARASDRARRCTPYRPAGSARLAMPNVAPCPSVRSIHRRE
jgi:hypothetical protein